MTKDLWINLPAKDINKSRDFLGHIHFLGSDCIKRIIFEV